MPQQSLISLASLLLALNPVTAEDWARFRGANGQGITKDKAIPLEWSESKNLAWAIRVAPEGWSSPVVSAGKVFLTGTEDDGKSCHILAYDSATGRLLWNTKVFTQTPTRKEGKNSYATPTPVIADGVVYAAFGQGGIAAVDTASGKLQWTYSKIQHYSQHGLGASPIVWKNLLIMTYDGSSPGPNTKVGWQIPWDGAVIIALDRTSSEEVWRAHRGPSRVSHATPVVVSQGDKEILLSQGGDVVQGFALATGQRLWSVRNEGEGLVPSPVIRDDIFFTTPGWPKPTIRAWKLTNPDNAPTLLWQATRNVNMMPTSVFVKDRLISVSEKGFAQAMDAKTGNVLWEERLPGSYSASPIVINDLVYMLSEQGECTIFDVTPSFQTMAKNKLPGVFQATPAVADGRLYLRSKTQLFCIATK